MSSKGLTVGAEATVTSVNFLGRDAVRKSRPPKSYRLPELDKHIRSVRTRNEARLMREARKAGVRTPCVYDMDLTDCSIVMENIVGPTAKDAILSDPEGAPAIAKRIGETVARIHAAGICHGDLTTSNMIVLPDGEICLIDFSMGCSKATLEDIGVDVRLLERAFGSAHAGMDDAMDAMMTAYFDNVPDAAAVRKKLEDIKNRGRYT